MFVSNQLPPNGRQVSITILPCNSIYLFSFDYWLSGLVKRWHCCPIQTDIYGVNLSYGLGSRRVHWPEFSALTRQISCPSPLGRTVSGFTTSTLFDDSIAGLTLERFMSLSKSICEPKEAWSNQCRYQTSKVHESNKIEDLLYDPFTLDIKTHWFMILSTWLFKVIGSWSFIVEY